MQRRIPDEAAAAGGPPGRWTAGLAEAAVVLLASAALSAWLAVRMGQDSSWDLQNYHFYNPFAFVNGRIGWDIQPAMRQTYFNPLIDVPFYLLAVTTTPKITSVLLAVFQGLLLPLTYGLARELVWTDARHRWARAGVMLACGALAVIGFASPLNVYEHGLTAGDNTSGVFVLAGLLCVVVALRPAPGDDAGAPGGAAVGRPAGWLVAAGGLLTGLAVGLKLTNAPFALALAAGLWLVPLPLGQRVRLTLLLAASGLAGALATGGFWWWKMYALFGNPLFPQMNDVFRSPWADPESFADHNYRAPTLLGQIFYPFTYNEVFGTSVKGRRFFDLRLPVLFLLGAACAGAVAWRAVRGRRWGPHRLRQQSYLVAFIIVSYAAWIVVFCVHRYMLLLEVLAPLGAACVIAVLGFRRTTLAVATAVVVAIMVLSYNRHPSSRVYWSDSFFDVRLPDSAYDGAMIVIASHQPIGFVLPHFPSSARFVRVAGNLYYLGGHTTPESRHAHAMGAHIRRAIDAHPGPIYVLYTESDRNALADARHFGLAFSTDAPRQIRSKIGPSIPMLLVEARRRP